MFVPKYTITPKLLRNIKLVAELTTRIECTPLPTVVRAELQQRAVTLSAHTSTRIEGNPLPLTEVKRLLKTRTDHLRSSEQEVVNYNDTIVHLNELLSTGVTRLDSDRILDIHRRVMSGLDEEQLLGKFRQQPVVVNNPQTGEVAYLPPNHKDVGPLMGELLAFIEAQRSILDPLILAGLFHRQFVLIHPFLDGNGRTTRLATKFLLADEVFDTFRLFSFENYYNKNVSRYFTTVGEHGDYYELAGAIDFTDWLEYFTEGIVDEMVRVVGELERGPSSPSERLEPHHQAILRYIHEHGYITDREYSNLTDRAKSTRALDFRKLIDLGVIQRHGRGKNTHYKLFDR